MNWLSSKSASGNLWRESDGSALINLACLYLVSANRSACHKAAIRSSRRNSACGVAKYSRKPLPACWALAGGFLPSWGSRAESLRATSGRFFEGSDRPSHWPAVLVARAIRRGPDLHRHLGTKISNSFVTERSGRLRCSA